MKVENALSGKLRLKGRKKKDVAGGEKWGGTAWKVGVETTPFFFRARVLLMFWGGLSVLGRRVAETEWVF